MANLPFPLDHYPVADAPAAVVVLPGGGYFGLADHEGEPVARWLNGLGVGAAVAKYRRGDDASRHPVPLRDALHAVAALRREYEIVGVLGFSAGGHLAATASTVSDAELADAGVDASARPDFAILCYPVIRLHGPYYHGGSRRNLLGERESDDALAASLDADRRVGPTTPPTFVFHTAHDPVVGVENALTYASALKANGVAFGMHVADDLAAPKHGVGLADAAGVHAGPLNATWTTHAAAWLGHHGWRRA